MKSGFPQVFGLVGHVQLVWVVELVRMFEVFYMEFGYMSQDPGYYFPPESPAGSRGWGSTVSPSPIGPSSLQAPTQWPLQ